MPIIVALYILDPLVKKATVTFLEWDHTPLPLAAVQNHSLQDLFFICKLNCQSSTYYQCVPDIKSSGKMQPAGTRYAPILNAFH